MAVVWTTLSSCGASHRSLSRYVASLLAVKSRSSRRAQIASLIARSSSFAYANNSFRSSARWPISSGLWPSATLMSWKPHPLRSTLIDVCLRKHQWRRSVPGFQLNSMCQSITNSWYKVKCDFNKAINMHSRGPTEQHFYVWEPRCGYLHKVKRANGAINMHSKGSNESLPKY